METTRSTTLQPALISQYRLLAPGILLTPLFGAGLILIWLSIRKNNNRVYEVFDRHILLKSSKWTHNVTISDIEEVRVRQNWTDRYLGVGTVELATSDGNRRMAGLRRPGEIAELIRHAAAAEKKRLERQREIKARTPDQHPGTLERLNDLAGMWQQGLITDEEYHRERKHFE